MGGVYLAINKVKIYKNKTHYTQTHPTQHNWLIMNTHKPHNYVYINLN